MQAEPQSSPSDNLPRIGRYELLAELARGGMGTVFLCRQAEQEGLRRLFALKMLHEHLARRSELSAMFLEEARIASRIRHHNVVSVVDFGDHEGRLFTVMEYVDGCSFGQLLSRNPEYRPPHLIVPIVIGLLNGLHAAHTLQDDDGELLGLIHRDVAPHNVLIGTDGVAQITDFGVAKASARISSSHSGSSRGTLAYSTPEQLHEDRGIDHRADIFSAGALLWTALTGRSLFGGDSDAKTVANVLHMAIRAPSLVGLRPPRCYDDIVLEALNRDRRERFASAAEMARSLRQTALEHDLLGSPAEVAAWVQASFAEELAERGAAIRGVAGERPDTLLAVPVLPTLAQDVAPAGDAEDGAPPTLAQDVAAVGEANGSEAPTISVPPPLPPPLPAEQPDSGDAAAVSEPPALEPVDAPAAVAADVAPPPPQKPPAKEKVTVAASKAADQESRGRPSEATAVRVGRSKPSRAKTVVYFGIAVLGLFVLLRGWQRNRVEARDAQPPEVNSAQLPSPSVGEAQSRAAAVVDGTEVVDSTTLPVRGEQEDGTQIPVPSVAPTSEPPPPKSPASPPPAQPSPPKPPATSAPPKPSPPKPAPPKPSPPKPSPSKPSPPKPPADGPALIESNPYQ